MRLRQDRLVERMQDEEFKAAFDEWEPDFKIADALLQFRVDNKMTQKELARKIGINRSDLSKLESASANPTLKTLKKIAVALGARLDLEFELKISTVPNQALSKKILRFSSSTNVIDPSSCDPDKYSVSINDQNRQNRIAPQGRMVEPALA